MHEPYSFEAEHGKIYKTKQTTNNWCIIINLHCNKLRLGAHDTCRITWIVAISLENFLITFSYFSVVQFLSCSLFFSVPSKNGILFSLFHVIN